MGDISLWVWMTVAAIFAMTALLTIAVGRHLDNPDRTRTFEDALAAILAGELDATTDLTLLPHQKAPRDWFGYWNHLMTRTGRVVATPQTSGYVAVGAAALAGAVGFLVFPGGLFGGIVGALVAVVGLNAWLKFEANRRTAAMEKQMGQLIQGMQAYLQGGATVEQALVSISQDIPAPLGDELRSVRQAMELNVSTQMALAGLADRVPSQEMKFLVSSMDIAIASGADLAPQLTVIEEVVTQRTRIRSKLRAVIAQVKPTAWLAYIAVPGMFVFSLRDPANRAYWFGSGLLMLVVGAVLYGAGIFGIRFMIKQVETA